MTAAVVTASITSDVSASTNTLTAQKPTGVANGDVLGALCYFRNATGTPTAPAGWTLASPVVTGHEGMALFVKPVPYAANETDTSYNFTCTGTGRSGLVVFRMTGANVTTPVDVIGTGQNTAQVGNLGVLAPAVTTTQNDVLLLCLVAQNVATTTSIPVTPDPGMAEAYELAIPAASSSSLEFASETRPTAGATGTRNPTWPSATSSVAAFLVGIAPAVVPPPPSGTAGWVAETGTLSVNTATPLDGTTSLRVTKTFGAGLDSVEINDGGQLEGNLSAFGDTFATLVKVTWTGGTGPRVRMKTRDSALAWQYGGWWTPTSGTTLELLHTPGTGLIADVHGIGFHFEATGVSGTVTLDVDRVRQGNYAGAKTGLQVWKDTAQAVVSAIRAGGFTGRVWTPLYSWSHAGTATDNGAPWVTDPARNHGYTAHLYYDDNHSGTYAASYATEDANAVAQGYASVSARALAWLQNALGWASANGVELLLGETGWPDTDAGAWNAVGDAVIRAALAAGVDVLVWAVGARNGTSYSLAPWEKVTGPGVDTANVQAPTVKAFFAVVIPPPVPVPPPAPGATPAQPAQPRYYFVIGSWNTGPDTLLSGARNRKVTWRRVGRSEASFDLDGRDAATGTIDELIDDLWVIRAPSEGTARTLFRGRVGPTSDAIDADSHTVTVTAGDYRAVLDRRQLWEGGQLSWLNADQALIAWGLIQHTQNQPGGSLGIARGVGQTTGVVRVRNDYPPGKPVGEALDQLAAVENGFDWDLRPDVDPRVRTLYLDVFYPSRGVDRGVILDYEGRVVAAQRQVDPGQYANAIRGTGADSTSKGGTLLPVRREAADIATAAQGRWDGEMSDPDLIVQATIAERTGRELTRRQIVTPAWTVTLAPNGWGGPDDFWLGDPVVLVVKSGRLAVVESLQVEEISCAWDDSDTVNTTVELGAVDRPHKRWSLRKVDQRLKALERR